MSFKGKTITYISVQFSFHFGNISTIHVQGGPHILRHGLSVKNATYRRVSSADLAHKKHVVICKKMATCFLVCHLCIFVQMGTSKNTLSSETDDKVFSKC